VEAEYEERRKDAPASSNCGQRHRGRARSSFNGVCASPARSRKGGHNDIPASSAQRRRKGKANSDPYALRCTRASLTVNSHTTRMVGMLLMYESEKQQRPRSPTFSNRTLGLPPMAPQKPIKRPRFQAFVLAVLQVPALDPCEQFHAKCDRTTSECDMIGLGELVMKLD
jgi:hypothetical protein